MRYFIPFALVLLFLTACHKEDLRATDFDISYETRQDNDMPNQMIGTITNLSSTPANTVSIRIDRYTDFNLVQDPIIIQIGKRLFQNDTAQFLFESSKQIKRVEITVENVK